MNKTFTAVSKMSYRSKDYIVDDEDGPIDDALSEFIEVSRPPPKRDRKQATPRKLPPPEVCEPMRDVDKKSTPTEGDSAILAALSAEFKKTRDLAKTLGMPKSSLNSILYRLLKEKKVVKRAEEDGTDPRWALA